jgi:hypothetical protein
LWVILNWLRIPTLGGLFKDVNGCSASIKGEEFLDKLAERISGPQVVPYFIKLLIKYKFKLNSDNTHDVKEHGKATWNI